MVPLLVTGYRLLLGRYYPEYRAVPARLCYREKLHQRTRAGEPEWT